MYRHVVVKSYVECGRVIDLCLKDASLIIIVNVELATRALSEIERETHKGPHVIIICSVHKHPPESE